MRKLHERESWIGCGAVCLVAVFAFAVSACLLHCSGTSHQQAMPAGECVGLLALPSAAMVFTRPLAISRISMTQPLARYTVIA